MSEKPPILPYRSAKTPDEKYNRGFVANQIGAIFDSIIYLWNTMDRWSRWWRWFD